MKINSIHFPFALTVMEQTRGGLSGSVQTAGGSGV